jgi:branched-chain amino acid transport system ATP-binding protein
MTALLEAKSLTKTFGGLRAVSRVDFAVQPGQIFSLIGPNGAGKTTVFNCITGFCAPDGGDVFFEGAPIGRLQPHRITERGIARTFQCVRLFGEMTALENVMVGRFCRTRCGSWRAMMRSAAARREDQETARLAMEQLQFVGLADKSDVWARNLPYGQQRRLEIARALATNPKLLLLDEPGAGMNPQEIAEVMELIRAIRQRGITVLLIEHHMQLVMGISDRIAVLDHGEKIAEGTPQEVCCNPAVVAAYLGEDHVAD